MNKMATRANNKKKYLNGNSYYIIGQISKLRKTLTSGLGLDDLSWPAVTHLLAFIYSATH